MTVNVTNTVGANNTIVLDSNSKIPAIDGSQVTALNASAFSTGTLAIARIDAGTSGANKILQLDGNAKIPAISGANLTNAPGPTVSTSDPAIDTNSTLGKKWVNKTSGEVYICTDATAGANVWTNVGAGSGNVKPYSYQGSSYGYSLGGTLPRTTDIHKYSFTSDGNATNVGDMFGGTSGAGCHLQAYGASSSLTHGYSHGGNSWPTTTVTGYWNNVIDKFPFAAADGFTSTDVGNLSNGVGYIGGFSSDGYGWSAGGWNGSTLNVIDRYSHSSDGNATDWADLTAATKEDSNGASASDYGYSSGGSPDTTKIERFAFASQSNGTDVGNLVVASRLYAGGNSSTTHGYHVGGASSGGGPSYNEIQKFAFASSGNSTDIGNLTTNFSWGSSSTSTTHGYSAGGDTLGGGNAQNVISKFPFAPDTNATDVGDLTHANNYMGGGNQY